jgi:ribosome recycling factor
MTIDEILLETEERMIKSLDVVIHEFSGVRTGKASPALVEGISVEAYGGLMRLRELAGITTPEPRLIVVTPWDATMLHPIEKAIQKSNLGINPTIDKKIIRLVLPELSQERRLELSKLVHKLSEDGRVSIRHVRRDAIERLKKDAKTSAITEDEMKTAEKNIQKLTDDYIAKIDQQLAAKEKELMTV